MALLFMDSFDHYVHADITEKWTSVANATLTAAVGRRSTAGLRASYENHIATKGVSPSGSTAIVGVAVKLASLPGTVGNMVGVYDSGAGANQVTVRANADGSISVCRGSVNAVNAGSFTVLGTSAAGVLSAGVHAYLELKTVLHASAGTAELRVNGVTVLSLTGVNTAASGTAWTSIFLTAPPAFINFDYDDLYVLDGSGSAPWNTFLGDVRVDALLPTGAGAVTGWTPSTGSNYQNVDDSAPDDDSTYNSAASSGLTDTFVVQDAPVVGATIYGVQINLSAKKSDSGTCSLASVVRQSGSNQVATAQNPSTSYAYLRTLYQVNPHTSAQWTEADFNADEYGYSRTA